MTTIPINSEYLIGFVSIDSVGYTYLSNMMYLLYCFLPFVCLTTLPELQQKVQICHFHRRNHAVAPLFLLHKTPKTRRTRLPLNKNYN